MNFQEAIDAHLNWKTKLRNYLVNPDKSLNPDIVGKDDQCAFGKWIYGEGKKYASFAEYTALKEAHAQFHKCAGEVVRKANAGDFKGADSMMTHSGEYQTRSAKCITSIEALKAKAG